jgi:hypothetical protein
MSNLLKNNKNKQVFLGFKKLGNKTIEIFEYLKNDKIIQSIDLSSKYFLK